MTGLPDRSIAESSPHAWPGSTAPRHGMEWRVGATMVWLCHSLDAVPIHEKTTVLLGNGGSAGLCVSCTGERKRIARQAEGEELERTGSLNIARLQAEQFSGFLSVEGDSRGARALNSVVQTRLSTAWKKCSGILTSR